MWNTNFVAGNFDGEEETAVGRRMGDDFTPRPLAPEGADDADGHVALWAWAVKRLVDGLDDRFPTMCAR